MSGRDSEPKKPAAPRLPNFFGRTRAMSSSGSTGWEATTIGFTLVGCIGACSGLGYWLDSKLGTSYWLPVLFLVGAVAGFREMFVVIGRLSRETERKRLEDKAKVQVAPASFGRSEPLEPSEPAVQPRERIFKVPPPPLEGQKPGSDIERSDEAERDETESVEDLIERLSRNEDDESDSEHETKR